MRSASCRLRRMCEKFAVFGKPRGKEVADIRQFFEALQGNLERNYRVLQEAVEYMNTKQHRLLATMERKQKLMSGASDVIQRKFFEEVLVLEEKISEVDNVLHEASEGTRELTVERRKVESQEPGLSDTSRVGEEGLQQYGEGCDGRQVQVSKRYKQAETFSSR